ncbi:MAG: deoxynucleoside kinase [Bacteroidota bacterium]
MNHKSKDKTFKHLAIAGNIGSGKTTLATMLSKHFHWDLQLEAVDENPYLEDFYDDMKAWSFHLQVYFLNSRFKQIKKIKLNKKPVIQDRTIYEDAHIFAKNLHHSKLMSDREYQNYLDLFDSMTSIITPPDLLIYLRANIGTLVSQIEERGRKYEEKIQIEYLKNLNDHYREWITGYSKGPMIIIDIDNKDFVKNPEDFSDIVNKIDLEMNGLFTF